MVTIEFFLQCSYLNAQRKKLPLLFFWFYFPILQQFLFIACSPLFTSELN